MSQKNTLTDKELIAMFRGGTEQNEKAIRYVLTNPEIHAKIYSVLKKMGADDDQIHDIKTDAIIVLDRDIRLYRFKEESSLLTYLAAVAKFKLLNEFRRSDKERRDMEQFILEYEIDYEEDTFFTQELFDKVISLMSAHFEDCKYILEMKTRGDSIPVIAQKLNIEKQSVSNRISRCLSRIRNKINTTPSFFDL